MSLKIEEQVANAGEKITNPNISAKELERDLTGLHLPEVDSYAGNEAELRALYGANYDAMIALGE